LESLGSSGSLRGFSIECWAWPVPTTGELLVVVEWPAFGIPQSSAAIDSSPIAEGARRAQPVWPEDAGKPSHLTRGGMRAQPEGLLGISVDVQVKSGRIATDPSCDFP